MLIRHSPSKPTSLIRCSALLCSALWLGVSCAGHVDAQTLDPLPVKSADGNETPRVPLRDAVESALQSHPAVREAAFLINQRESENRIVRSDGKPVIEYSLLPGYDPESSRDAIIQLNVSGRVPVYDFGRQKASQAAAEKRIDQYRFLYADSEEQVAVEVVEEYLRYSMWRDAVTAGDLQLKQLNIIRDRIKMRISAGLADVSELRRTDVSIGRATLQRDQVISQMNLAAQRIKLLTHTSGDPLASLETAERALRPATFVPAEHADDIPSVAAARAAWEAKKQDVKAARASQYPTISVGATNSSYVLSQRVPGSTGTDFSNTTRYGIFLTGRVPLGGGARHQVAAAKAASDAAQSSYDTEVLRQDMVLQTLTTNEEDAETRTTSSAKTIDLLEQARDLYWQEYILSKRRLTEVFDIEREIYQSRIDQLQARADRLSAVAQKLGVQGQLVSTLLPTDPDRSRP